MSWQDIVGRQMASVLMARAMQAASQGAELPGIIDEPAIEDVRIDRRGRGELSSGQSRRTLVGRDRDDRSERRRSGASIDDFCFDLADYLAGLGLEVTEADIRRGLRRLATEGWDIDVRK